MALVHSPSGTAESLRAITLVVGVILLALLTLYLVGFDQGAISRTGMYMPVREIAPWSNPTR